MPDIDIEKYVNGYDADHPPGPTFTEGSPLFFTYVVTNTGDVTLNDIMVVDNVLGPIVCPTTTLDPGQSMDCGETEIAHVGTFFMKATVEGVGNGETVTDMDPVYFVVEPEYS
jgi:hypothetical protein